VLLCIPNYVVCSCVFPTILCAPVYSQLYCVLLCIPNYVVNSCIFLTMLCTPMCTALCKHYKLSKPSVNRGLQNHRKKSFSLNQISLSNWKLILRQKKTSKITEREEKMIESCEWVSEVCEPWTLLHVRVGTRVRRTGFHNYLQTSQNSLYATCSQNVCVN